MSSRCRWIIFDAVGTLIHPEPGAATVYYETARRHGSRLSAEAIAARFRSSFRRVEEQDLSRGPDGLKTSQQRERHRWREIVTEVIDDIADPDACFEELFKHFGQPSAWQCFDDVSESLTSLKRRGLSLAVASNFDNRLHSVCHGIDELQLLDARVISSEGGYRKPATEFFDYMRFIVNQPFEEMLFVGDDITNDVHGPLAAGCGAALIRRNGLRDDDPANPDFPVIESLLQVQELVS